MNFRASQRLRGFAVALFGVCLLGCAHREPPLYYWGNYQANLYGHFTAEQGPEEQIQALEAVREKALARGKALPPGLQAHLGMLYGQTGRADRMAEYLEAEKAQFPESTAYMDFLLKKFAP